MTAKRQGLLQIEKNGDRGTRIEGQGRGRYIGTRTGAGTQTGEQGQRDEKIERDTGTERGIEGQ